MSLNRKAYRFFHEHGGQLVGRQAEIAASLARAEQWLDEHPEYQFEEEQDTDADLGDHEYWCNAARIAARGQQPYARQYGQCEHYAVIAAIVNENGDFLASLGGILDPTPDYMRVIRAELALEVREQVETDTPDVVLSEN